jgi:hypothetical protein
MFRRFIHAFFGLRIGLDFLRRGESSQEWILNPCLWVLVSDEYGLERKPTECHCLERFSSLLWRRMAYDTPCMYLK